MSTKLITKEVHQSAIEELRTLHKDNRQSIRLKAIISAKEHGVAVTARAFRVTTTTIRSWVKGFIKGGISGLEYKKGRGRKSHLSQVHYDAMLKWTQEDCNITINHMVSKLQNTFGIKTSKSAVHRVLHKLKL